MKKAQLEKMLRREYDKLLTPYGNIAENTPAVVIVDGKWWKFLASHKIKYVKYFCGCKKYRGKFSPVFSGHVISVCDVFKLENHINRMNPNWIKRRSWIDDWQRRTDRYLADMRKLDECIVGQKWSFDEAVENIESKMPLYVAIGQKKYRGVRKVAELRYAYKKYDAYNLDDLWKRAWRSKRVR